MLLPTPPLLPSGRRFTRFNNATDLIAALGPIAVSKQETALGTLLAPVALGISSCCGTLGACNLGRFSNVHVSHDSGGFQTQTPTSESTCYIHRK